MAMPKKEIESFVDKCGDESFSRDDSSESEVENEIKLKGKERTVSGLCAFEQLKELNLVFEIMPDKFPSQRFPMRYWEQ